MLPPFHGERMRRYGDAHGRDHAARHRAAGRVDEPFALQAAHAVDHPRRDPPRGLRDPRGRARGRAARADRRRARAARRARRRRSRSSSPRRPGSRAPPSTARCGAWTTCSTRRSASASAAPDLDERDDILSMLIQARDEDGAPLDEDELRDQLVTLLLAGHETTATALAWAFDALFRNPDVLATARGVAGRGRRVPRRGRRGDAAHPADRARRRPPARRAARRGDGAQLDAGTAVFASVHLLHRRADLFPDPLAFRPERFLGDERPSTYAWIPFGGGMRRCLGAAFAQFEMRRVLRTILEHTDLRPAHRPRRAVRAPPGHRRAAPRHPRRAGRAPVRPRVV